MDKNWSKLNRLQLGELGEYYAKMMFTSFGYYVFTSEVDDHGIDFVVKSPKDNKYYEVQVKSVRNNSYVFLRKEKTKISDETLVCYLRFTDGELPNVYVFPTTVWNAPNSLFVNREYEYGISYSKKSENILNEYLAEKVL